MIGSVTRAAIRARVPAAADAQTMPGTPLTPMPAPPQAPCLADSQHSLVRMAPSKTPTLALQATALDALTLALPFLTTSCDTVRLYFRG